MNGRVICLVVCLLLVNIPFDGAIRIAYYRCSYWIGLSSIGYCLGFVQWHYFLIYIADGS
jgi:hypothetical protein